MAELVADTIRVAHGSHVVVGDLTVRAARGQFVAIMGQSGAGKSTLLRALAGLTTCQGRVNVHGVDPAAAPRSETAKLLSYLPQHVGNEFPFRVWELVSLGRRAHTESETARQDAARRALLDVGLEALAERTWPTLSGGEQKRVMLAQAICQDAPWMLLDEPTSALDAAHTKQVMALLRARADRGLGVIAVTHDVFWAKRYATHAWLMHDGHLIAAGTTNEALTPSHLAATLQLAFTLTGSGDLVPQ